MDFSRIETIKNALSATESVTEFRSDQGRKAICKLEPEGE